MQGSVVRLSFCLALLATSAATPSLAYERPDRPYPPAVAYDGSTGAAFFVEREDTPSGETHLASTVQCSFGELSDRIVVYGTLIGADSQLWKPNSLKFKQGANLMVTVLRATNTLLWRVDNVVVPFCEASVGLVDKDKNRSFYDDKDVATFKMECAGDLPAAMGLSPEQTADFLARSGGETAVSCKGKAVGTIEAGCFRGDTVVSTEHGPKAIRDIAIGDRVWSWDEAGQKKVLSRVTKTFVHPARGLRFVRAGDEVLRTTDEHPFWVEGKGWTRAADLQIGMRLRSEGGELLAVASSSRSDAATFFAGYVLPSPATAQAPEAQRASFGSMPFDAGNVVYNIEVDGTHNYFVGDGEVLVHNK